MSNITRQINLNLDVDALPSPTQEVIDADTGERLQFWRANSLDFSILFSEGSSDFDMTAVGMVSLEVKSPKKIDPPSPEFPLLMHKEVEGPFVTGQPVVISFDANETAISHGSQWLSVTLYSADGERMTTVSGFVFVMGNGYGTANVPDVQDLRDEAVQAAQDAADARDQSCACAQASSDEADRAQQIADNLEALSTSLSYRGVWSSSSTPPDAQRGWFWMIGEPVTFAGLTWSVGDAALYNGEVWQAVPIQWLLEQVEQDVATLKGQVMGGRNHLALRGGYAVIQDSPELRAGTSSYTVFGWVRPAEDASSNGTVIAKGSPVSTYPAANGWAVQWRAGISQDLAFSEHTGGSQHYGVVTPNGSVPRGEITHFAIVRDTTQSEVRIYLNGELITSDSYPSVANLDGNLLMTVGCRVNQNNNPGGVLFAGDIWEAGMLSFAADADDVRKLMAGDIPIEWRGGAFGGQDGVVLHLDPRNIGPAPSQWIEPNGHHALYHDTGADSAQELEDARYLKFNYTILPGAPDIVLGGARPIIPEGWSVTYVGIASSGGTAVTYHLYYTDGTSQTEFAEIETLGTPGSSNGQAHPIVTSGRFNDPLNPFFGRVVVSFSGGAGVNGTVTLKIEKIV